MEASIDNTKRDLHDWIMRNRDTYKDIYIKIADEKALINDPYLNSAQRNLDRLLFEKKLAIERFLKSETINTDAYLEYILMLNNHIKQLLGL